MTFSVLGTLSFYMIVNSFTPGPGNILARKTTTQYGWGKGKKLILGICCGYFTVQMICTLALYELNTLLTPVLSLLKYIGAVYMCWLAIHILLSRPEKKNLDKAPDFFRGFLLQLVNVKIYFYISTLLTVYLIPYMENLFMLVTAGIIVTAVGSAASLVWAFLGVRLQSGYEKYYRLINSILALFLFYCAWGIMNQ